jgi:hypothetical protein
MMLNGMAASSKLMITKAERRFPVRVRVAIPPTGFGERFNPMHAWLDDNCDADRWEITPAGMRGVINDAIAVYFRGAWQLPLWRAGARRWAVASRKAFCAPGRTSPHGVYRLGQTP